MEEVMLKITPTKTAARDMPFGMAYDVCQVLEAYGLGVTHESLNGLGLVEVNQALLKVLRVVPPELGGRKGEEE